MTAPTLRIDNLRLGFKTWSGTVDVLHGISLHIKKGERVALVGESGSGKSVTARIVLGMLQQMKTARISGTVEFEGTNLETLKPASRHALRGTALPWRTTTRANVSVTSCASSASKASRISTSVWYDR